MKIKNNTNMHNPTRDNPLLIIPSSLFLGTYVIVFIHNIWIFYKVRIIFYALLVDLIYSI